MSEDNDTPLDLVAAAYGIKFKEHGATPEGVMWSNGESQILRFELLVKIIESGHHEQGITVNDLGCGYGAFFKFLAPREAMKGGRYFGYEICEDMIVEAKRRIGDPRAAFSVSMTATQKADYSFASGTYNMKGAAPDGEWTRYVKESLRLIWEQSAKGLAFNLLDGRRQEKTDDWLYYPDPGDFLEFCRRDLSPDSELVDTSPLLECTILVRR